MYKEDLALNNLQWLICRKTQPNTAFHPGRISVQWTTGRILPSRLELENTPMAYAYNECPVYDTKQSHGEIPAMLEVWWMPTTPLLHSLPGPLRRGVVAPDSVPSMCQIVLNCVLMLNGIAWNRTVLAVKLHTYPKLNRLKIDF